MRCGGNWKKQCESMKNEAHYEGACLVHPAKCNVARKIYILRPAPKHSIETRAKMSAARKQFWKNKQSTKFVED